MIQVKVDDAELLRRLNALKKTQASAAIRKGTRQAAKIVAADLRQRVPVKSGKLRKGIKVRALPRSRRWVGVTVHLEEFYASFVDLGTKHIEAKQFYRASADAVGARAINEAKMIIEQEIQRYTR